MSSTPESAGLEVTPLPRAWCDICCEETPTARCTGCDQPVCDGCEHCDDCEILAGDEEF